MAENKSSSTNKREQRLAAKLRENLRRRKSQAKARAAGQNDQQKNQDEGDAAKKPDTSKGD